MILLAQSNNLSERQLKLHCVHLALIFSYPVGIVSIFTIPFNARRHAYTLCIKVIELLILLMRDETLWSVNIC